MAFSVSVRGFCRAAQYALCPQSPPLQATSRHNQSIDSAAESRRRGRARSSDGRALTRGVLRSASPALLRYYNGALRTHLARALDGRPDPVGLLDARSTVLLQVACDAM